MMKIGRPQKEAKPMTLIMLEVHFPMSISNKHDLFQQSTIQILNRHFNLNCLDVSISGHSHYIIFEEKMN